MKPTQHTTEDDMKAAEISAFYVAQALSKAMAETGANLNAVLAGANAQIASEMAASFGGKLAAQRFEETAATVRNLPSAAAYSLAFTSPKGSA